MIVRQHLVPSTIASKITSGKGNTRKKICIHETANTSKGANAHRHSLLQYNGNSRNASWHWTVDDKEAVQSFTHDYRCWHAGTTNGNNESIGIEICVNSDGDYRKAVQNAAFLVAKILKEENLTINDIVQHNHYSGKNCPRIMRKGDIVPWHSFIQMVKSNLQATANKGVLTVNQYEELRKIINEQNKLLLRQAEEIAILKQQAGLTETGRTEIRKLIEKACEQGIFNKEYHYHIESNGKRRIDNYNDKQLQSYLNAYVSKTAK